MSGAAQSMIIFIIIIVAYFGPLFLLPSLLKMSTGILGQLMGG